MRSIRMAALALGAVLGLGGVARAQFGPAPVYLEPAEKRTVRRSVELVGTAEARRQSVISAETAGRVEKMLADAGDFVKAGAPLCQMRRLPVELQLKKAQGQLAAAEATLRKMEQGYRKEEIVQAEARVKASKAGYERWTQEFERTKRLLADGASTQAEMDIAAAAYRQAKEKLAEDEAYQALVTSGNRPEDIDNARAQVASQAAAVEELRDTLDKMTVAMPFDGFVVRKLTEEGQWLAPGLPVVEVIDVSVVRVQLDVPERFLAGMDQGAEAPVVFEALGADREFAGKVSQIVPSSASGTHTVLVRVDVPNTVEKGRPVIAAGLFARVWLPVGEAHEAILVPKAAVIRQGDRDLVYTVSDTPPPAPKAAEPAPGGKPGAPAAADAAPAEKPAGPPPKYAVALPIRIIQGYGRLMEVQGEGLRPGTLLVTRGTYLLAPGSPVQVRGKEAPPAPPAPVAPAPKTGAAG